MSLLVRPARVSDKPALMAIAKKVWDGNDYLPVFFEKWVRDVGFRVAEDQGRVVGCGKATHFGQGEWWLEGLRIDPDRQGHGMGTKLSFAILARTLEYRPKSLRLSTAEVNEDSIRIIGRMGFEPIVASHLFWGGPRDITHFRNRGQSCSEACPRFRDRVPSPRRVTAYEALDYLAAHDELGLNCGLLPHTWKFREVTPRYMAELERRGCLFGVRERIGTDRWEHREASRLDAPVCHSDRSGGISARRARGDDPCRLAGLLIVQPHLYDPRNLDIGFVSGDTRVLAAFRRFIVAHVRRNRGSGFAGMATGPEMRRAFERLGMKPERGIGHVLVFEYAGGK